MRVNNRHADTERADHAPIGKGEAARKRRWPGLLLPRAFTRRWHLQPTFWAPSCQPDSRL